MVPCRVPAQDRRRPRSARRATTTVPPPAGLMTVHRRVSQRGQIMVATERIQVGMIHARKIVTVTAARWLPPEAAGFRACMRCRSYRAPWVDNGDLAQAARR
jgi:hypothetical protein